MKFADKLFFATTFFLTIIFTAFGMGILFSAFQKTLSRELEQADTESRMMQYVFEMTYQSLEEYGEDYAIGNAVKSMVSSTKRDGSHCFVFLNGEVRYEEAFKESDDLKKELLLLSEQLTDQANYVNGIRQINGRHYLLNVCASDIGKEKIYLGSSQDVTVIYGDRKKLMTLYQIALLFLLAAGGAGIYVLSRYLTRPITTLDNVVGEIAAGNYERRCQYHGQDEIGALAGNFNRMTDRLVEQMREKEREAKQKEDFTAAFAHELKTPLTSIIGYADMLNSIALTEEERREAYFYIYSQGKRLESLSHKLLELAGMEQTPLHEKPVNTKDLEENLRRTMRPILKQKGVWGKIHLEKETIYGDQELLLSLLYNLLDNALKAVDKGGFTLVKGQRVHGGYEVKVVDNGRGIPEGEIDRITEAFYMVDKSRSRREGGAGIGMALCQKIITLHHGTLRISSKLGEGTVVQLFFPDRQ